MENREIKFKVWNKFHKQMYEPLCFDFNNGFVIAQSKHETNHTFGFIDLVLLQYTGLRDKNGKEIYEGDVVKSNYYSGIPGEFKRIIGTVIFESASFMVDGLNQYEMLRKPLHGYSEVIGNIYENPELLKPNNTVPNSTANIGS